MNMTPDKPTPAPPVPVPGGDAASLLRELDDALDGWAADAYSEYSMAETVRSWVADKLRAAEPSGTSGGLPRPAFVDPGRGERQAVPVVGTVPLSLSEARGWAARIWCEPQHSSQEMDTTLAETIAHQLVYAYNRGHRDGRSIPVQGESGEADSVRMARELDAGPPYGAMHSAETCQERGCPWHGVSAPSSSEAAATVEQGPGVCAKCGGWTPNVDKDGRCHPCGNRGRSAAPSPGPTTPAGPTCRLCDYGVPWCRTPCESCPDPQAWKAKRLAAFPPAWPTPVGERPDEQKPWRDDDSHSARLAREARQDVERRWWDVDREAFADADRLDEFTRRKDLAIFRAGARAASEQYEADNAAPPVQQGDAALLVTALEAIETRALAPGRNAPDSLRDVGRLATGALAAWRASRGSQ